MKQRDNLILGSRDRIGRRDIEALFEVTAEAAQAQIPLIIRAEMLSGNDVVDLMGEDRGALGTTTYELARWLGHA
jgi:hypothetical protein